MGPGRFKMEQIAEFQKMLLIKCVKEEKGSAAIADYVDEKMGRIFVQPPPVELEDVYKDTDNRTPTVFILSTGADPTGPFFSGSLS